MHTNPIEPTPNPYQAPTSDVAAPAMGILPDGTQIRGKLFSAGHVAWASFLATPIAGCVLLAINYHRLEQATAAKVTWFVSILVFVGFVAMAFLIPDNTPTTMMNLVFVFLMYHTAKGLQGRDFSRVMATGGKTASGWLATGIGLLVAVAFLAVIFGVMMLLPEEWFFKQGEL